MGSVFIRDVTHSVTESHFTEVAYGIEDTEAGGDNHANHAYEESEDNGNGTARGDCGNEGLNRDSSALCPAEGRACGMYRFGGGAAQLPGSLRRGFYRACGSRFKCAYSP